MCRACPPSPSLADAAFAAGRAARRQGDHQAAIAHFRDTLRHCPEHLPAHNNLATALQAAGELDEALQIAQQAVALAPDKAVVHSNLGALWQLQGDNDQAIAAYEQALRLQPDLFLAHLNLAKVLSAAQDWPAALSALDAALALQPTAGEAHLERGRVLSKLQRHHEALAASERALALLPEPFRAYIDQSVMLGELGYHHLALLSDNAAIACHPDSALAYYNRATVLRRLNRCAEALQDNHRAIALQADYADAHWNASLNSLLLGDYTNGWPEYEWRWRRTGADPQHYAERPLWTGREAIAGKTILLHAEQGMGDSIQFCRYAPLVAALGAKVLLAVYPALMRLCASLPGITQILPQERTEREVAFDLHAPLLSLPRAFATTLETIPAAVPYLRVQRPRRMHWAEYLGAKTRPRIGLVWSGNPSHQNDRERSLPLARLCRLDDPAYQWVSLQHEPREADQALLAEHPHWLHPGETLEDFADTAALIANLDLVIGVDTAVVHLAGALGVPTWTLLCYHPDWRWLLARADSPWYPSMRLFRQPTPGDWDSVLRAVQQTLAQTRFTPARAPLPNEDAQ
ncbi:tetratricopeptide repeat protein [Rhabdochromatium marinum]|uniref:tetratricopeptide repeat protein n=1 Tax=Rhabdochromatium marinum TaxID=48729 RepID=UPI001908944B